eukprot:COSAG01_NODE_18259_length_1088_cov_2.388271_1_plen_58_part_00
MQAYGRKNFDPVIKEWKWPDFGNVTITLARTEGLKNLGAGEPVHDSDTKNLKNLIKI